MSQALDAANVVAIAAEHYAGIDVYLMSTSHGFVWTARADLAIVTTPRNAVTLVAHLRAVYADETNRLRNIRPVVRS